jgi:hypothetical protein
VWVLVSIVPGARGAWDIVAASLGVSIPAALLRSVATRRSVSHAPQRFELPTLRLVLPIFAAYLALSSLWPLTDASLEWRGTLALTLPGISLSQPMVYRTLEHIAAFTLVGYIGAEFHGRDNRRMRHVLPRVLAFTVSASALLEIARGFHDAYGSSLLLFLFTQLAAVFGAYVYILQRAHVRALVKRRALIAELAARGVVTAS